MSAGQSAAIHIFPGSAATSAAIADIAGAVTDEPFVEFADAKETENAPSVPGYQMRVDGLYFVDDSDPEHVKEMKLSGPFGVLATSRSEKGNSWGVLLKWQDADRRSHEWAMPRQLLVGDGIECQRHLVDHGLVITAGKKARDRLINYLMTATVETRVRAVSTIGWHGKSFVLPGDTIGGDGGERCLLQLTGKAEHRYYTTGSLKDWQDQVARYCAGNSRLAMVTSAAFAAPLLGLVKGAESGGIHLRGKSSMGKSTALLVAGSVWGGGDNDLGFLQTWRATDNGLESTATLHNDALLCLDELSQVDAKDAGKIAYMLANGQGKNRAGKDHGTTRPTLKWRLMFVSSGEISLAEKMAEVGKRAAAGQQVRVVEVPADPGAGLGLFETLHGFDGSRKLADHLIDASKRHYGEPIRAFLRAIVDLGDSVGPRLNGFVQEFVTEHSPPSADSQVERVLKRFALIAAAGELAVALGIVPWPSGEARTAAKTCFDAWLTTRGSVESTEIVEGISKVRQFIELHGESRFTLWGNDARTTYERAGFRRANEEGAMEYYVLPQAWRSEVCQGFDAGQIARALAGRGLLLPDSDGKPQSRHRLPGADGPVRCYHLAAGILGGEADGA